MPFPAVWGVAIFQNFLYAPRQLMVALRLDSVSSRIISVSDRRVAKELGKGVTTPFPWAFWEWSYVSSFTIFLVFPYLYMVNRPGKCHFQPSGRDLGAKIFLRSAPTDGGAERWESVCGLLPPWQIPGDAPVNRRHHYASSQLRLFSTSVGGFFSLLPPPQYLFTPLHTSSFSNG